METQRTCLGTPEGRLRKTAVPQKRHSDADIGSAEGDGRAGSTHQHAPPRQQALHDVGPVQAVHAVRPYDPILEAVHFPRRPRMVEALSGELLIHDSQQLLEVFPVHVPALQ